MPRLDEETLAKFCTLWKCVETRENPLNLSVNMKYGHRHCRARRPQEFRALKKR